VQETHAALADKTNKVNNALSKETLCKNNSKKIHAH
jgi:hypothetical protein